MFLLFFYLAGAAPPHIYSLSLHDALPIFLLPCLLLRCWPNHAVGSHRARQGYWQRPPYSRPDRKSTRLNSSHVRISYAVFCLKKKKIAVVAKELVHSMLTDSPHSED